MDEPRPGGLQKKALIFAMYAETTAHLRRELSAAGIPNCSLRGTRAMRDEAVRRSLTEPPPGPVSVLLATEARDCAGLDLPALTHVIFYHRVLDQNVEAQVAARGQRLGRKHNLEIVALINEAEAEADHDGVRARRP